MKRFWQICRWFAFGEMMAAAVVELMGAVTTFPKMWFGPTMWDWPFWIFILASFWFLLMARWWYRRARGL